MDVARLRLDADDLVQQYFDIALSAKERAQWSGDLVGRKQPSRHLIQHRAEEMVVAPVDERDTYRSAG